MPFSRAGSSCHVNISGLERCRNAIPQPGALSVAMAGYGQVNSRSTILIVCWLPISFPNSLDPCFLIWPPLASSV